MASALALGGGTGCKSPRPKGDLVPEGLVLAEFGPEETQELGDWVVEVAEEELGVGDPSSARKGLGDRRAPKLLRKGKGAAYVALRSKGALLAEVWGPEGDLDESVRVALSQLHAELDKGEARGDGGVPDTIELDLAHSFHTIEHPTLKNIRAQVSNRNLGIRGLELRLGTEHFERWAPTAMIARNLKVRHGVGRFWKAAGVDEQQFVERGGQARWFEAQQFLIDLPGAERGDRGKAGAGGGGGQGAKGEPQGITKLFRGNVYVQTDAVSEAETRKAAALMSAWMSHHLHEDGRMAYLWFPSRDMEGDENNMIRQWMATNALIGMNEREQDPAAWARIAANIDYNLEHYYRQEGEYGVIQYANTVKLGAMALAALAIINHPERERWRAQEEGLRRTIMSLWSESGEFTLFYRPRHSQENAANFYPGETLLLWSQLYAETRDPELLRRYTASYRFYRTWHLDPAHRRPAFVPWHSRASVAMWKSLGEAPPIAEQGEPEVGGETGAETGSAEAESPEGPESPEGDGDPPPEAETKTTPEGWPEGTLPTEASTLTQAELVEWVFTINDWLIDEMAVWDDALYDDEKGRFYTRKKNYGIPHASATGVFMEGLVDAYVLAREVGDQQHAERYRRSLARALRSVMQLQYVDEVDLYYVVDREAARGGLRTSIFHNDIRVDNVQHVLMGVLDLLEVFEAKDYATQ